jgi:hypothetical protein
MNQRQRFIRKIVYVCIIAALLLPLSWLSQPETTEAKGGQLAQMRSEYRLGQAQLGEIDPASETIKLATLGMRGVAANMLWNKSHEYNKNEDWVNLAATLEQIARLQPNFVSVWIYQGWNLSYNISVQFDDYQDRYHWVIRGVDFLKEGAEYNTNEPRLLSKIGYTIGNKIGRADEKVLYRQLFRDDDDFHGDRPKAQRDNWLVGREWMLQAEDAVAKGVPLRGETPLLFYSHPVMCLINYAESLEEEGTFGEVAKDAWRKAAASWVELSNRDMPTQLNMFARLSEKELYEEKSKRAQETLAKLAPEGIREQLLKDKIARLPAEPRSLFEMDPDSLTKEQEQELAYMRFDLAVTHAEVAQAITGEHRAEALQAADEATLADELARAIGVDRDIVNYDYWKLRCEIEPTDAMLTARKQLYDADDAFTSAELTESQRLYEAGLKSWREVLDAHPTLIKQVNTVDELVEAIDHYRSVLNQLDQKFPEPFALQDVLDAQAVFRGEAPANAAATKADKDAAEAAENDPSKPAP